MAAESAVGVMTIQCECGKCRVAWELFFFIIFFFYFIFIFIFIIFFLFFLKIFFYFFLSVVNNHATL